MKSSLDLLRAVFISPEVLTALVPFAVLLYWREPASFFTDHFSSDIKATFGVGVVPLGLMVASYKLGGDILSPQGARRILLDWPDYYMLKNRVVLALIFCGISLGLGIAGAFGVVKYKSIIGATLIFAGILSSAASLATVAVARWKIRELFRE
jgi:hypothetical protein